jgi:hypothetical protein
VTAGSHVRFRSAAMVTDTDNRSSVLKFGMRQRFGLKLAGLDHAYRMWRVVRAFDGRRSAKEANMRATILVAAIALCIVPSSQALADDAVSAERGLYISIIGGCHASTG